MISLQPKSPPGTPDKWEVLHLGGRRSLAESPSQAKLSILPETLGANVVSPVETEDIEKNLVGRRC